MEDFPYLPSTPPDMQSQSSSQPHPQSSMQSQMTLHHQQQQAMLQQMQHHHHIQQQAQQAQMQQAHQQAQQQQQAQSQQMSAPFAYPPPASTPSAATQSHALTPRSFAEAMGIDPNVFTNEISFQLPSFLTGPTVAPGGGGDVIPGSASNLRRADSYSEAWYPNQYASSSGMDLRSPTEHPGFSPYGIQSSQDDQYGANAERTGGTGFSSQDDTYAFAPGEMTLQSSQDVQPLGSSSMQSSDTPNYTSSNSVDTFPAQPLPAVPQVTAPIGPLPTVAGAVMPGLYSTSGFDMLGVLARVASRPDPKIVLGPVDLTCSFTVVDIKRYDHPIVYASPTFHRLTGYEQNEIIGRNCRFLQVRSDKLV